jgi:hypothetical protein
MPQIAQIRSSDGGALLLPARDAYDRELVFEQAEFYARRNGAVDLQIGRSEMRVARSGGWNTPCMRCNHPVGLVNYLVHARRLCSNCVKHSFR